MLQVGLYQGAFVDAAGMNDVIHKPLDISDMASRISAALSQREREVG